MSEKKKDDRIEITGLPNGYSFDKPCGNEQLWWKAPSAGRYSVLVVRSADCGDGIQIMGDWSGRGINTQVRENRPMRQPQEVDVPDGGGIRIYCRASAPGGDPNCAFTLTITRVT